MIYALLMMAGSSTRMGLNVPKQYIEINGKYLFEYPLETFDNNKSIERIILIINPDYYNVVHTVINSKKFKHKVEIVFGGSTRQESVYNALKFLYDDEKTTNKDYVLIHDACRVLLTERLLNEIIANLEENISVVPALCSTDSICYSNSAKYIEKSLDRSKYYLLQTPQAFNLYFIFKAHKNAIKDNTNNFTDDTSLAIISNGKVKIINGDKFNFKVTTYEDLFIIKKLIGN